MDISTEIGIRILSNGIEQVKKIGLDILEVAPAPLLALTKFQRDEIAAAAKANDIELTFFSWFICESGFSIRR